MRRAIGALIALVSVYAAWLGMMALHEVGHVVHAVLSGGGVARIVLPLAGFSRTDLSYNPHPQWVAWGGPVWGVLLPLGMLAGAHAWGRGVRAMRGFAGFCLVVNGAYIGLGWAMTAGDGRDLVRHGAPVWALVTFGLLAFVAGLYLWHRATGRAARSRDTSVAPG